MWNSQDEMPEVGTPSSEANKLQVSLGTTILSDISLHQFRGFDGPFCLQQFGCADPALGNDPLQLGMFVVAILSADNSQ